MIVHKEMAERDSELLYRVIFENTLDGMEVIDAETGRVVLANQAMAKIFGFTFPKEMIGLNPLDYILTEDRDRVARMMAEDIFQKNLRRVMELRAITRDGREIWISALGVRIEYQGRLAGLISVRDITAQKLAETRLQASEEERHLLMQNSDEAVVVAQEGMLKFANPKAMEITGYSDKELTSRPFTEFIHPDDRQILAELYLKKLKGEETPHGLTFRAIAKEGRVIWFGLKVVSFTWEGKPAVWCFMKDITERKKAEEAFLEGERKYRSIAENVTDVIWITDMNFRPTYVSPSVTRLLGYSVEEAMAGTLETRLTPTSLNATAETMAKALASQKPEEQDAIVSQPLEMEMKHKDGSTVWASVNLSFIRGSDGQRAEIVGILHDMTERKRVEETLERKEQHFRALIENSSDGISVVDRNGTVLYNSPSIGHMLGYTFEERIGLNMLAFVHPDDIQLVSDTFVRSLQNPGVTMQIEVRLQHKDSTWRTIEITATNLLHDAAVEGIVVNLRDTTERKRVEENLRRSEERFKQVAESADEWIWEVDAEGLYTYASPVVEKILGYKPDEVAGKMHFYELFIPEAREELKKAAFETFAKHEPLRGLVNPNLHKNGSRVILETNAAPILDEDGRLLGYRGADTDITDRKLAEEATKESEERYRLLAENVSDVIWVTDMNMRPTYLSPSITRLLGYSLEESMARGIGESLTPSSLKAAANAFIKAMAAEKMGRKDGVLRMPPLELEMIRKDGSTARVASTVSFIRGPDGQPVEIMGVLRDITERKRAEEALRGSEERFRNLVETTSDWVWEVDTKGICTYVSPKVRDILGYEPEDLLGKIPFDFIPTDEVGRMTEVFTSILASQKPFSLIEINGLHKDGHTVVLETSGVPFFDAWGALLGYRAVSRDVTERKVAEEALRGSEERFRGLVETTSDFVWELDENGVYTYVSPKIHEILGYEAGELLGKHPYDFGPDNGTSPETSEVIVAAMTQHKPFRFVETTRIHRDGHPVVMETSGVPFFDWDGMLHGYRGIDRDITERQEARKQLEQSLRKLEKTLDGTIQAITLTVESRDRFTAGHQKRVAQLACAIAQEMGLTSEQIKMIRIAGLLHDIGKISVPQEILSKPGKLSDVEFQLIKVHSQTGYEILKTVEFPWPIADIVIQHHERMNGSGYPSGIREDKLLMEARILGVADVVEAMSSHRPYRVAPGVDKALEEISRNSGILYDPNVAYACLRVFTEKGFKFE